MRPPGYLRQVPEGKARQDRSGGQPGQGRERCSTASAQCVEGRHHPQDHQGPEAVVVMTQQEEGVEKDAEGGKADHAIEALEFSPKAARLTLEREACGPRQGQVSH